MDLNVWLSFVLIAVAAVLTPGPAVLMAVTHSARFGLGRSIVPILGNVSGLAVLTLASTLGVGALMSASSDWFLGLRIAGGLYLIYLGVKVLRASRAVDASTQDGVRRLHVVPSHRRSYLQGLMVALSNPKALLLIGALFPQFLDVSRPIWQQLAILGATLMVLSFTALMMYAALAKTLVGKGRETISGKVNKISGALFIAFGVMLASGIR
jgi:threonine/homoserine/homoserine lactone efflux protein